MRLTRSCHMLMMSSFIATASIAPLTLRLHRSRWRKDGKSIIEQALWRESA